MPARATPNGSAPSKPPSQKDTSAVQKKHTTRARNRRAQELEEQQIVNEELGTRSSKVKAYSIVKEFIQSQRRMSTTRGRQRAPQKRSKDVIQSDEESDIAPPPPKKQYISESQPVMNLQPMASDNEHGYGSDTEPRGGTSNFRRYTQGPTRSKELAKFNPDILKKVIQDTSQDAVDEGASIAEEEEERRDLGDVDEGSDADGEVTNSNDIEDLEALMSQPAALQAALAKETPRVTVHGEDEEVPPEPELSPSLCTRRKTLPRHRLEDNDDGEVGEEHPAGAIDDPGAYHGGATHAQSNISADGTERMHNVRSETRARDSTYHHHSANVNGRINNTRAGSNGNARNTPSNAQQVDSHPTSQLGCRAQAMIAERPNPQATIELHTRAAALQLNKLPSDKDEDNDNGTSPATQRWPVGTHLVYSKRGKVCITKQNPYIQLLAYAAIDAFLVDLVFREEEVPVTRKFMHEAGILERCTRRLQEDNNEMLFKLIRRRIKKDVDYAKDIIAIADERLHLDRGTYKHSAKNLVRTEYGLDENNLQAFLGLTDQLAYIFPVKANNIIDYDNPFMRPIFPQVLYENFFKGPQSFAFRYAASFPVAHGRKEIPIGMLCLVTTAIYMALHDIAYENDRLSIQRKAASWDAEYADVMRFLVALKNKSPYGFSTMMAKLYEQASHGQQLQSRMNRVRDALAKINFDKLGTGSL